MQFLIERTLPSEDSVVRTGALFGLYTFFISQPSTSTPHLSTVSVIPIPIGESPICKL